MANKEQFLKDGVGSFDEYLKAIGKTASADDLPAEIIASIIDHTQLKQNATKDMIEKLCDEARTYSFKSVCVNPYWVSLAAAKLKGSAVKVCTVIGFPLGASTSRVKGLEVEDAIANGATEVDMVLNIGAMKGKDYTAVKNDVLAVVNAAKGKALTKVILETCLLSPEEIAKACEICAEAGADYVKTSTGFSTSGANEEVVSIMRKTVGTALGVKASGGVRSLEDLAKMVKAGATRIGASCGAEIMQGKQSKSSY